MTTTMFLIGGAIFVLGLVCLVCKLFADDTLLAAEIIACLVGILALAFSLFG